VCADTPDAHPNATILDIYNYPWNVLVYAAAATALILDLCYKSMIPFYVLVVMFIIWDLGYFFSKQSFIGRDPKSVIDIVTVGRQYMSWYMAFFGIFFGLLLTGDPKNLYGFLDLAQKADVSLVTLVSPFVFVSLSGLYVPIQIKNGSSDNETDNISLSLKALLIIVTISQKLSNFLLLHCICRLVLAIDQ
jgi:hypothetical protein